MSVTGVSVSPNASQIALGGIPKSEAARASGHAFQGVQTAFTDIWDRALASGGQNVFLPPTQTRKHDIVSTSADDTELGSGTNQIRITGLRNWFSFPESETLAMDGLTPVETVKDYVIINEMIVLTRGGPVENVGIITATAQVDGTISAQINAGIGKTIMAIYGISRSRTLVISQISGSINRTNSPTRVCMELMFCPSPDKQPLSYRVEEVQDLIDTGTSNFSHTIDPPLVLAGEGILKWRAISNSADTDVSAAFNMIIVDY